tara:strand:+ start:320 stop:502 length:183 start_codon:yes stop_codon:yes gene_type:complete
MEKLPPSPRMPQPQPEEWYEQGGWEFWRWLGDWGWWRWEGKWVWMCNGPAPPDAVPLEQE